MLQDVGMTSRCLALALASVLVSLIGSPTASVKAWLVGSPVLSSKSLAHHPSFSQRHVLASRIVYSGGEESIYDRASVQAVPSGGGTRGCSMSMTGDTKQEIISHPRVKSTSDTTTRERVYASVVLVGSDIEVLREMAGCATSVSSAITDLSDIAKSDGSRGVEDILARGRSDEVFICTPNICLNHPEVRELVKAQPLAIHVVSLNGGGGDEGELRERCKLATRYTVVVAKDISAAKSDLSRLIAFARRPLVSSEDVRLDMGKDTFFLSLTFPDFTPHIELLPELTEGVDAMELRVDLLANHDPYSVVEQLSTLRRHTGNMPVVFTVRSKGQCGAFQDDADALFRLARWGLRAGAEVLDVEANWPLKYREDLINEARDKYPGTMLVGSYHVVGQKTTQEQARNLFLECYHNGKVDAVKVVTTALEPEDSFRVHAAAQSLNLPVPYIGLCLTPTGKLSRVLNSCFTPVTHEKLPFVAAPGQLSSAEIMKFREELDITPARSFFLFGSPISASPSPNMHNAGFRQCGLPHQYSLCEGEDPEIMSGALARNDFGGASVTIPHKQNILPYMDEVSEAAAKIGAVNTVIVTVDPETGERQLHGDNTDWLGILRPVRARLEASGKWPLPKDDLQHSNGIALVVGAGGAAMAALFAMQELGMDLVVYNRTPAKAEELASRFGGVAVSALDAATLQQACGREDVDVVVSTIPGSAEFTLPEHMLKQKPVVFDAAYKPALTALLAQAKATGCPYVQGAEMLVEQGLEQFQLWTRRRAPRSVMAEAVFNTVDRI